MAASLINCSVFDHATESYSYCSYSVPYPVSYNKIKELFPFEGQFHFRLQCDGTQLGISSSSAPGSKGGGGGSSFVWLDLNPSVEEKIYSNSSKSNNNCLVMRALVISAPHTLEDADLETYFQSSKAYLDASRRDPDYSNSNSKPSSIGFGRAHIIGDNSDGDSSSISRGNAIGGGSGSNASRSSGFLGNLKSVVNTTVNSVKEAAVKTGNSSTVQNLSQGLSAGATSIWSSVKAATVQLTNTLNISSGSELTDQSEENLANYSDILSTIYSDKNLQHLQLLQELWSVLFPGPANKFQRDSMRWKDAGFQTTDPVSDLKSSGLLAVHSAIYIGKTYPQKLQQMLLNNRENVKTKYPLIIVIVNVTLLLVDVLKLRDAKYLSSQFNCWEVFEEKKSFFDIFSHCVSHVDAVWTERGAVRADFGGIIKEVKDLVLSILADSPRSLNEFTQVAISKGLVRNL